MSIRPINHTRLHLPGFTPSPARPLRMVARNLDASQALTAHHHAWGQVTYASQGVLRVTVADSSWIVPPLRAIWIPPNAVHEVAILERAQLRELIAAFEHNDGELRREALLTALILDELSHAAPLPMQIALPEDKRLRALCEMLIAAPSAFATLADAARRVGASERTLARLFERDLGMSFGQWRQQMRLAHAAAMIARGMPMSRVAAELGYASQSAFSAMFKKTFGKPPSRFFAPHGQSL